MGRSLRDGWSVDVAIVRPGHFSPPSVIGAVQIASTMLQYMTFLVEQSGTNLSSVGDFVIDRRRPYLHFQSIAEVVEVACPPRVSFTISQSNLAHIDTHILIQVLSSRNPVCPRSSRGSGSGLGGT